MTSPGIAAGRFGAACLLGLLLGLAYSLLRPLRPRLTALADLVFVIAFGAAWVELGFGICQGDLRLGYTAGLFVGIFAWELTLGKWLRRWIFGIYRGIYRFFRWVFSPLGRIFCFFKKIGKNLFANSKKWVTMKKDRNTSEGEEHEKMAQAAQANPFCLPPKQ